MKSNLYYYTQKHKKGCTRKACNPDCEYRRLDEAIWDAYEHFKAKFGYFPEYAIVRAEEVVKGEYPVKVKKAEHTFMPPPSHFFLCPIIAKQARRFQGERKSCKK